MKEHLSGNASPTERTMAWLREQGYTVDKVEQRVGFGRTTRDLFGCLDIVAIKAGSLGVLGLQVTSAAHVAERIQKVEAEPRAKLFHDCGNTLWVVGWAKRGEEGKRKLWTPTVKVLWHTEPEAV